jgi:uncharacterized protein YbjT (DUF2867 family)
MNIVMGGTGHVGSATAQTLLARGEPVTIVTRDATRARGWRDRGAEIVEADINDVSSLHAAFRRGSRAFLLNPPADTASDTDAEERRTVAHILAALDGSGLEKVVAASTYGAQRGDRIGDLNVLWELEQGLKAQSIPCAINRGAYYMSNWDGLLDAVRETGELPSTYPAEQAIAMVAPQDLGAVAADRLMSGEDDTGIRFVEGPRRYSAQDVANAFAAVLDRDVKVCVIPPDKWEGSFRDLGFSREAAESYARMTRIGVEGDFEEPDDPLRGPTTLEAYIKRLVAKPS